MAVNAKVAEIYVDLVARTAAFKAALDDATATAKKFSAQTRAEMNEAKASIALLGEEVGVRLPRHLRTFVAGLPGVAAAMSAAFNAVAVFALIGVVVEAGKKVAEWADKSEAAARKNAAAWDSVNKPLATSNDELRVTNDRLANSIAKLEGKPQNGLKLAIDEAIVSADKLSTKLDADLAKLDEVLKKNAPSIFGGQLFKGEASTSDIQSKYADLQSRILDANTTGGAAIRAARANGDPAALAAAQKDLNDKLSALYTEGAKFAQSVITNARLAQAAQKDFANGGYNYPTSYMTGFNSQNMDVRLRAGSGLLDFYGSQQDSLNLNSQNGALNSTKNQLEGGKDAAERAKANAKAQAEAIRIFVEECISDYRRMQEEDERVTDAITKTWDDGQKQLKAYDEDLNHTGERWKEFNAELAKNAEQATVNTAHMDELRAKMDLATGVIGPHAAALATAAAHLAQYNAQLKTLQDEITRINSDTSLTPVQKQTQTAGVHGKIDSLNAQQQVQALTDAQSALSTTWTGMIDGVFDEIIKKSHETQSQLGQIAKQTIDSLNTEMAKSLTGQKTNYHAVFQSAAQSLAKSGLEKAEGAGLQALGLGGGKMGSKGNPMYVKSADAPGASSSGATSSGVLGMLNDSDWASSLFGGKLFGSGSFFGGGHALGGDVMAGVPIDVGEMGRERFTPSVPGHITPNSKLGGGDTWNIDARNTDPALSRENFAAALHATRQQVIHDAAMVSNERNMRVPH